MLNKTYSVFTTTYKDAYDSYAKKNIDTHLVFWPQDIKFFVYAEGFSFPSIDRLICYDLYQKIPELVTFKKRHENNPRAHGRRPDGGEKDTFLFNYVKFAHKSFTFFQAIRNLYTDWLIWLDADSLSHTTIPLSFIDSLCPNKAVVSYLGREDLYTETGFVAFNRKHPRILEFVSYMEEVYLKDLVFTDKYFEQGYTDCHAFDFALEKISKAGATVNNLTPKIKGKHPFINGPLGQYMDHMKGPRKKKGSSHRTDLKETHYKNHHYWSKIK